MTTSFQPNFTPSFRRERTMILAFVWILGFLLGSCSFALADNLFSSLMRGMSLDSVSIVNLLWPVLLPFLFSAFAVFISQPWLLLPVGFLKAFSFSFVSMGVIFCFGSAGWLFRLLLMFGDLLSVPLLFWYMRRHFAADPRFSAPECMVVFSLCLLIGSIDYGYILPFLADMIYF